jgi:phospholipase/lecithinase/hemolysin
MKSWLCPAVALSLCVASAQAASFSSLVVFGDSLSDVGNFSAITGGAIPGTSPTGTGYSGGRFSNGPVWVEQLAPQLGLSVPTRSASGGTNYAHGNATTTFGQTVVAGLFPVPNLRTQISGYAAANASNATQLFTVLAGANDLFGRLQNGATLFDVQETARTAAANVVAGVGDLYADGGRNVLVANLPDLGDVPRFNASATAASFASAYTATFNAELATGLTTLEANSAGLTVYSLDLAALFDALLLNKPAGLRNVDDAAYINDPFYIGAGTLVGDPAEYLFYDEVHPTTIGHGLIASAAVAAIPEPAAALLGLLALPLLRRARC